MWPEPLGSFHVHGREDSTSGSRDSPALADALTTRLGTPACHVTGTEDRAGRLHSLLLPQEPRLPG